MSEGGLQGYRPPFSFNHPNFNYGEFAIIKHEPGLIIDSPMSMPIEGLGLKLRLIVPRFSWCIQDCSLTSLSISGNIRDWWWKSHTNLTHPGKYFRPSKVKIMRPTSPK